MRKNAVNVLRILVVFLGNVAFLITFVFAFLSNTPSALGVENVTLDSQTDLFRQDVEKLGLKYPSVINPAGWVFVIIWPIIFFWNMIGSCYMTASLCLPLDKSPVKRYPALIPISFLILWIFNWTATTGWLFSYDREYFGVALFCLIFTAVTGYMMLGLSYKSYFPDILILEENSRAMLWLVRILIHNGFAMYITWITCAWKLNLATVITYQYGINQPTPANLNGTVSSETAGIISLSILLVEIVAWFVLENFVFEKYCRYTLTIYPTLIFAFAGIFVKNFVPYSNTTILTMAGLILVSLMFLFRVAFVIYRHRARMMYHA